MPRSRYKRRSAEVQEDIDWREIEPPVTLTSNLIEDLDLPNIRNGYLVTKQGIDRKSGQRMMLVEPNRGQATLPERRKSGRPRAKGSMVRNYIPGIKGIVVE